MPWFWCITCDDVRQLQQITFHDENEDYDKNRDATKMSKDRKIYLRLLTFIAITIVHIQVKTWKGEVEATRNWKYFISLAFRLK